MIYLLLSIFCSSVIFLIFRSFTNFKVNNFQAIVVNYFVAACAGFIHSTDAIETSNIFESSFIYHSLLLGAVFISLFNIMAMTAQKNGASVAAIANKMAMVIPVSFAVIYYGDEMGWIKGIGVGIALFGVYLSTAKEEKKSSKVMWLPIILFLGSGFIDTFLKFTEATALNSESDSKLFTAMTFLTAFIIGLIVMTSKRELLKINKITFLGGLTLGVINYGSIYFLLQCFRFSEMDSSTIFPINNVGVVLLTTLLSLAVFRERLNTKNKFGILISVIAILLISVN